MTRDVSSAASGVPAPVTVRAAAKINLHLGVGAPREDGFHPLDTVYQTVGLYDDVTAAHALGWTVSTSLASYLSDAVIPPAGANIVDAVGTLLAPDGAPRAAMEVSKSIPVAGGMAGGSADAAAALVALDRLWGLETTDEEMLAHAARLGSDVPFALVGGTAHGTGRGELVTPLTDNGSWSWVVVPDEQGLSTPSVYRRFDELRPDAPAEPPSASAVVQALEQGDSAGLAAALHNDLELAALDLRPDLRELLDRGVTEGALRGIVSGSGPTCVFLCDSPEGARSVAAGLAAVRPVVLVAHGPVSGAHVVEVV